MVRTAPVRTKWLSLEQPFEGAPSRIEATRLVVTNLDRGSAEWLYEIFYCAREQAEISSQVPACLRAHVLPLSARQPGPPRSAYRRLLVDAHRPRRHFESADLAKAEFATLRLKLSCSRSPPVSSSAPRTLSKISRVLVGDRFQSPSKSFTLLQSQSSALRELLPTISNSFVLLPGIEPLIRNEGLRVRIPLAAPVKSSC
jgi:hypothetical protein